MSGGLRVTTVGTGTCVPRLDRGGPCVFVREGATAIAVDLGLGALRGMLRVGLPHQDLDAVLLTHLHPDHTAELVSLLFAANYDEAPRSRPLALAGGVGLSDFLGSLRAVYGHWLEPQQYELAIRELVPGDAWEIGDLRCVAGSARHIPSSLAYRFEAGGRSLVVTGDTGPCAELEAFAAGVDLLIAEASLAPGGDGSAPLHLSAAEAGALARRAGARRLLLTHLYPAAERADPAARAADAFGRAVEVAEDGLTLEV